MGLTAHVIEAGGGVGGTWWWNRYPGARSDSDSYIYGFMFDDELWKQWRWTERYPEQHEVRAYLEHVAQRYDLLRDITFNTRVQSATFDEHTGLWSVATDTGETVQTHHLIAAVGTLSVPNTPILPGADTFGAASYPPVLWPHDNRRLHRSGRVVAPRQRGAAIPIIVSSPPRSRSFRTANSILPPPRPVPEDCGRPASPRRRHPRTAPKSAFGPRDILRRCPGSTAGVHESPLTVGPGVFGIW